MNPFTDRIALPPGEHARPDAALVARLADIPTANLGDAMDRLGAMDAKIGPIWTGARLAGPAFTVWTRPGDNLAIHAAIATAQPGDVIVVAGAGDETHALIGEMMGGRAKVRGIAGFVIDGAVRDAEGLAEFGMPVFARAITPAGPYKDGPGRLGRPVAVGGVPVLPGDLVVGDADGVVVLAADDAEDIAASAEAIQAAEVQKRRVIEEGLLARA